MAKIEDDFTGISIEEIETEKLSQVKTAFYAESERLIELLEREAKSIGVDKFYLYSVRLLNAAIENRYEYAMKKREIVLRKAVNVLIASGKTESEARMMLGLGE